MSKKRSKRYKKNIELINENELYSPLEALGLIKDTGNAKFDETVEVHFNLSIDPRHADQQLRGTFTLPHGTGKDIKIAVVTKSENVAEALDAGASWAGEEDILDKIQNENWFEFDILISTPDMMSKVGKLGKTLGTKGLMPTPKNGTVTSEITKTIKEFKLGKIEYRNDKHGIVHLPLGKASFTQDQLYDNFITIYEGIQKVKPSKAKGTYMKSLVFCNSMGPGVTVEPIKNKWKGKS